LAAQRFDIENFGKREGFSVASWYQDIQTGAGKDPLTLRPGLATALKEARDASCPLIVSRLDRLSRNVHFIAGLMEHKVHFAVAAFGRDVDKFTLHIYASIAQQERKMISERVKATAQIAKRQGKKFGLQLRSKSWQWRVSAMGRAALSREAMARAQTYRVYVEWALKQPGLGVRPISFRAAAIKLNERNLETPMGGRWRGHQLQRMARRLRLDHPVAHMPESLARARVWAAWKKCPTLTGEAVAAAVSVGTPRRLDIRRTWAFIQEFRQEAARRSPIHKEVGWYVDERTTTRIRIGDIWARHPTFTAKQVIERLGPAPSFVRLNWVHKVLHECWRARAKPGPKRSRVGRKSLNPWRNHTFPRKARSVDEVHASRSPLLPTQTAHRAPSKLLRKARRINR
jgi:DNA invertase Pin-like site-specific DNA recombinase